MPSWSYECLSRGTVPRWQLISIRSVRHRRFDPAPGIDFIKQQLEGIVGRDGYLHRLSRSSISTIEQLADCSNPGSLALRSQRQACQLDNNRRRMLTREFLHIAQNFGAPTRIATLALTKFVFAALLAAATASANAQQSQHGIRDQISSAAPPASPRGFPPKPETIKQITLGTVGGVVVLRRDPSCEHQNGHYKSLSPGLCDLHQRHIRQSARAA